MRILVTWGSKRGGTEGIARTIGDALRREGVEVLVLPAREAKRATGFDAAVIGGALYANRWHADARRFVILRQRELRKAPVWFFSSGPLDDSATRGNIPPTRQVEILMERVGAQGHVTFGGRLTLDANTVLAKKRAGDWRDPGAIRNWASEVARALPTARPRPAVVQAGASWIALFSHAALGWVLCATLMGVVLHVMPVGAALAVHALLAPLFFVAIAIHYFRARGARDPLPTALTFVGVVVVLDLVVVAGTVQHSLAMFASFVGLWLPLVLTFLATLATGELMSTMPWSSGSKESTRRSGTFQDLKGSSS
jgi:menaquinone-dependent protoporphyrinogen oxidase